MTMLSIDEGAPSNAMSVLCTHTNPNGSVKSAAFTNNNVLIFSTVYHTSYLFPWGDTGITQSWNDVIYIKSVNNGVVRYMGRRQPGVLQDGQLYMKEMNFKEALHENDFDKIACK